jgi:hypothetical protein
LGPAASIYIARPDGARIVGHPEARDGAEMTQDEFAAFAKKQSLATGPGDT